MASDGEPPAAQLDSESRILPIDAMSDVEPPQKKPAMKTGNGEKKDKKDKEKPAAKAKTAAKSKASSKNSSKS